MAEVHPDNLVEGEEGKHLLVVAAVVDSQGILDNQDAEVGNHLELVVGQGVGHHLDHLGVDSSQAVADLRTLAAGETKREWPAVEGEEPSHWEAESCRCL